MSLWGSVTAVSRTHPSFSSLMVLIITALLLASSWGSAVILRDPAAKDVVGQNLLALVVVHLDSDVFTERCQRHRWIALEVVDLVGPVLEGGVVGDPGLQRDCGVRRLPGIWCGPLESPPSYQGVTSVVRVNALHLLSPATDWPSIRSGTGIPSRDRTASR